MEDRVREVIVSSQRINPNTNTLVLSPERSSRVMAIVADLETIDGLLAEARANTMAINLGTMKLDFATHLAALKLEATNLLTELAQLSGIALFFNRYIGEYPARPELYALFGINPNQPTGYVASQW